jgi:RNA ligase (TIGR02306 family)
MSKLIVSVEKIGSVVPHPDADNLDLIVVKQVICVTQKNTYKEGDLAVFIPHDSILPEELAASKGLPRHIKARKIRGIVSQGLTLPMTILPGPANEGDDVTSMLGITKYEPPMPTRMNGVVLPADPRFPKYTDIEHLQNFKDLIKLGDEVIVTEKIHGTNFRVANVDGTIFVGSHNNNLERDPGNLYWRTVLELGLDKILKPGQQLFGEIYGKSIQSLRYGLEKPKAIFFDLKENGRYIGYYELYDFCEAHSLEIVPLLYVGPWLQDLEIIAQGPSILAARNNAAHEREGCVIKHEMEMLDPVIGRVILKILNPAFLANKHSDSH